MNIEEIKHLPPINVLIGVRQNRESITMNMEEFNKIQTYDAAICTVTQYLKLMNGNFDWEKFKKDVLELYNKTKEIKPC